MEGQEEEMQCSLMKELQDAVTCQICFLVTEKPKSLRCLHFFCRKCLAEIQLDEHRLLCCPICRVETQIRNKGVESLPTAFFVNTILDLLDKHKQSISCKEIRSREGETNMLMGKENRPEKYKRTEESGSNLTANLTEQTRRGYGDIAGNHLLHGTKGNVIRRGQGEQENPHYYPEGMNQCYSVSVGRSSLCEEKQHRFQVEQLKQGYFMGDRIVMRVRKFCRIRDSPCNAWADSVVASLVDYTGRALYFEKLRNSDGGWELSCKADNKGSYTAIIKVNSAPIAAITVTVQ